MPGQIAQYMDFCAREGLPCKHLDGLTQAGFDLQQDQPTSRQAARRLSQQAGDRIQAGAAAIQCAERLGSIHPGKQADLLVLNVDDYRQLGYRFGTNLVSKVIKRGMVYQVPGFPVEAS